MLHELGEPAEPASDPAPTSAAAVAGRRLGSGHVVRPGERAEPGLAPRERRPAAGCRSGCIFVVRPGRCGPFASYLTPYCRPEVLTNRLFESSFLTPVNRESLRQARHVGKSAAIPKVFPPFVQMVQSIIDRGVEKENVREGMDAVRRNVTIAAWTYPGLVDG